MQIIGYEEFLRTPSHTVFSLITYSLGPKGVPRYSQSLPFYVKINTLLDEYYLIDLAVPFAKGYYLGGEMPKQGDRFMVYERDEVQNLIADLRRSIDELENALVK
jgi:hypothetical protein